MFEHVHKNAFLKSILRQPIRSTALLLLLLIASFSFAIRFGEYWIIRQELSRIEATYRPIGFVSPINPQNYSIDHDVTLAAEFIAQSQYIHISDTRRLISGLLDDLVNTIEPGGGLTTFFPPSLVVYGSEIPVTERFFLASSREL